MAKFTTTVRNALGDWLITQIGAGAKVRIYTTPIPADANAAASGTQLAELTGQSPFAPATAAGVITVTTLTAGTGQNGGGTAAYYRVYKSDGTTCIYQDVVTSTAPGMVINPSSNVITNGQAVTETSFTIDIGGA